MSDTVLVFPKISAGDSEAKESFAPPLGILTLAGVLLEQGISVKVIDQRTDNCWKEELRSEIEKKPMFIGISSMSGGQIKHGLEIASFVKEHYDFPLVWGGVHPTLEPVSTIEHELVDFAVIGEAERTVIELVDFFKGRRKLKQIKGVGFKQNNRSFFSTREDPVELDALPLVPFSLLDLKKYKSDKTLFGFKEEVYLPLETSRGCSFRCAFCRESTQPFPWRAMSPGRVIEHVASITAEYGIRSITFCDDNFCVDHNRIKEILDLLIKKNIRIQWYANVRPDYFLASGFPILNKFEKSGCRSVTMGLESGSDAILKKLNKGVTTGEILEANKLLAKTKIRPLYTAIFGFPYDTLETIKQTCQILVKVLLENPRAWAGIVKLIPVPGTRVLKDCVQAGFVIPKDLGGWSNITTPRLLDYSTWMDAEAYRFMKDIDYLRVFISLTRMKPKPLGKFIFSLYARILQLRFRYDYFGLWLEPKIFAIGLILRNKTRAMLRGQKKQVQGKSKPRFTRDPCGALPVDTYHFLMTNYCNAQCIFCNQRLDQASRQEITLDKFKNIISHLPVARAKNFHFSGGGEPLLCRDLFLIIKHVNEFYPWIKVIIRTNGLLIGRFARELAELNVSRLEISIHGTVQTNDLIVQREGSQVILDGVASLKQYLVKYGRKMYIEFDPVVSALNLGEIALLIKKARELGVNGVRVCFCKYFSYKTSSLASLLKEEDSLFFHKWRYNITILNSKRLAKRLGIDFSYDPMFFRLLFKLKKPACCQPWQLMLVDWDGDVYPCFGAEEWFKEKVKSGAYRFGNLLRESAEQCWLGSSYMMIKKTCNPASKEKLIPECVNCHMSLCLLGPDAKDSHIIRAN